MSYYYCARSDPSWPRRDHGYCNGYVGEFDTYVCRCSCHDAEHYGPSACPVHKDTANYDEAAYANCPVCRVVGPTT